MPTNHVIVIYVNITDNNGDRVFLARKSLEVRKSFHEKTRPSFNIDIAKIRVTAPGRWLATVNMTKPVNKTKRTHRQGPDNRLQRLSHLLCPSIICKNKPIHHEPFPVAFALLPFLDEPDIAMGNVFPLTCLAPQSHNPLPDSKRCLFPPAGRCQ